MNKFFAAMLCCGLLYCLAYYQTLISMTPLVSQHAPWSLAARDFYNSFARNQFQSQAECVEYDEKILYKPKNGKCHFENAEFYTDLTFKDGRRIQASEEETAYPARLAVIGDSFAMGWGVNDDQTFAHLLSAKTHANIVNYSVSSYGTYRELTALIRSGRIKDIDTIIIQYCINDYDENKVFVGDKYPASSIDKLNILFEHDLRKRWQTDDVYHTAIKTVKKGHVFSLVNGFVNFFKGPSNYGRGFTKPVTDEASAHLFLQVIEKFPELEGKRIIVFDMVGWNTKTEFVDYLRKFDKNHRLETLKPELEESDYYFLDGHLNATGHRKIAEQLAPMLATR